MEQSSSYANRMEGNPSAAARLVTPRTGYTFDDEQGVIRRGVAVRADHPAVIAHRGAFTLADEGCERHASAGRVTPKARPTKPASGDKD